MSSTPQLNEVTDVTQYNAVRAEIETLKATNASLVFDYSKPADNKNARSHIYKLRQTRADVERTRKAAKAEALAYGRKVDAVAHELTGELDGMIDVHQQPLDEIEQQEKARVEQIRAKIEKMRFVDADTYGRSAAEIQARLAEIEALCITDEAYQEFVAEARQVHEWAVGALNQKLADAGKREAEQAELNRLRQESEANAKREHEERIAREAAENARLEAEAKAKAEADAARMREQAAVEAERRALQEAREATERAERERQEARQRAADAAAKAKADQEAAAAQARENEARRQQEAKEAEARAIAERAKNERIRNAVIGEVAYSLTTVVPEMEVPIAQALATAMLDGEVARVTVDTTQGAPDDEQH